MAFPIMTMGSICITPEFKRKGYGKFDKEFPVKEKLKRPGQIFQI